MEKDIQKQLNNLPETPGVYLFRNDKGDIIYIGKAANIRRRAKSYFLNNVKGKLLLIKEETKKIETEKTKTTIEALIKEAELIKKEKPRYNIKEKDDKSFLYLVITNDFYPRVILERGKNLEKKKIRSIFGPFVFSSEIRSALQIIRKIFPFSTHTKREIEKGNPCFFYQINLCPGTCAGKIDRRRYLREVKNIELFFQGKKKEILKSLEKEMKKESDKTNYERAGELKRKRDLLTHIQDITIAGKQLQQNNIRVEGYDVSNISGKNAVGSMVVMFGEVMQKEEYRLFKLKTVIGADDTGMIKEIIKRRFKNNWQIPHLILVDGGKGQVSAVKEALSEYGLNIPVVGVAKGKDRKKEEVVGKIPFGIKKGNLIRLQNEAHRFAINYHKKLRQKNFIK